MPTRRPRQASSSALQIQGTNPSGEFGVLAFGRRLIRFDPQRRRSSDLILPGFIDLQVNGGYGIDVMSASVEDLLTLSHCLAHEGVTGWLPTVISSPLETIERVDAIIAEAIAAQAESESAAARGSNVAIGATILGMHLEGPFLSPHRLGAHPPLTLLPIGEPFDRVIRLKTLKMITIAPELDGALDAIRILRARGVTVSLGHSSATYEQAVAGVQAGARMFTHVFNAMPPLHHREPGIAGAALTLPDTFAAIIPDAVHLHPAALRFIWSARRATGTILTTDRCALSRSDGYSSSLFGHNNASISIREGAARLPDDTLAGSIITMLDAVKLMNRIANIGPSGVAYAAAINPAKVLGRKDIGSLLSRAQADVILTDDQLNPKAVFVAGREID